jgi:hypothetical protein
MSSECYRGLRFLILKIDDYYKGEVIGRYKFLIAKAQTEKEVIDKMKDVIDEFWFKRYGQEYKRDE